MNEHSAGYEMAKRYYDSGAWSKAWLRMLVDRGRLTKDEHAEITGETYAA